MKKTYRTKQVEIEAVKFTGSSTHIHAIEFWMEHGEYIHPGLVTSDMRDMYIDTLEGSMKANPGDYIIKGLAGEFHPCKPNVFHAKYEEVSE